jgi:Opioid growth factor receptor (OGFr) conserved region
MIASDPQEQSSSHLLIRYISSRLSRRRMSPIWNECSREGNKSILDDGGRLKPVRFNFRGDAPTVLMSIFKSFLRISSFREMSRTGKFNLIDFFRGKCTTRSGESLADFRRFTNIQLESRHDYIQLFFPSPEPSAVMHDAPVVTPEVSAAFSTDAALRGELLMNLDRMTKFWDFKMTVHDDGKVSFALSEDFLEKPAREVILRNGSSKFHNLLRLTRVIKSLYSLSLPIYAYAFQEFLIKNVAPAIGAPETTVQYWRIAIPPEPST